jgi:hypothetical protein
MKPLEVPIGAGFFIFSPPFVKWVYIPKLITREIFVTISKNYPALLNTYQQVLSSTKGD